MDSGAQDVTLKEQNIKRDMLAQYAHNQHLSRVLFPISITAIGLSFTQWTPLEYVLTWFFLLFPFMSLCLFTCYKYENGAHVKNKKDLMLWYVLIGTPRFIYTLVFSSLAFWAWTPEQPETYFIVVTVLATTMAMNAAQSGVVFPFYLMEMLPRISVIVISAAMSGNHLNYTIAFLSCFAALTFTKIAHGINKSGRLVLNQKYEIAKAKEDVERASRAKSSFLATMSHEVRTPLNGILGIINLMKYTPLSPQQDEYVETIRYSGETLLTMLNDILDFSKMEAGKLDIEEVPFETSRLINSVVGLMGSRASEKGVNIRAEIFDNVPAYITTDPTRVRQVLLNLISNAVKFTERGEVVVSIKGMDGSGKRAAGEKTTLRFEVRDSGIGIPPEARANLFKDFTQVDSSTSRKYGGSGLGLSICRRIVEMMDGKIDYESTVGRGSTFWFAVPVIVATAEQVSNTNEQANDFPLLKPLRILLAEDNVINQKVVVGLLNRYKHQVDIANNGLEAVEAVKAKNYDLILMDMQMPVLDGLEATKQIRSLGGRYQSVPIVALTANSFDEVNLDYAATGITDHVAKPLRLNLLFRTFALHLPDEVIPS